MAGVIFGVDLGTTFTKCAWVRPRDGVIEVVKLDREYGSDATQNTLPLLRSAVTLGLLGDKPAAWVGTRSLEELEQAGDDEGAALLRVEEAKLWIGADPASGGAPSASGASSSGGAASSSTAASDGSAGPPWRFPPHRWTYRAEDLGAIVLRKVKAEVEAQTGERMERIVLTHPQYFSDTRRKATRDAAAIAGLEVVDMMTEPDAAALLYGVAERGRYMVFDLGGGTLDVTIAELTGERLAVLASDGIRRGGRDFDRAILQRMVEDYRVQYEGFEAAFLDERTRQAWLREAERMKRQLGDPRQPLARAQIVCRNRLFPDGQRRRFELTREELWAATERHVQDCVACAERALARAHLGWSDLAAVLLVGGATRMAHLREALERASGRPLRADLDVDSAVAQGAARRGHQLAQRGPAPAATDAATNQGSDAATNRAHAAAPPVDTAVQLSGALARGIGVRAHDPRAGEDVIAPLVPKDASIPRRVQRTFRTTRDGQTSIPVELYEGDDRSPLACEYLGRVELDGLPPGPARSPVEVTIEIEANGTKHLVVEAMGQRREAVIEWDAARVVAADEIARRREHVESLTIL